jgi:hypothetical protein
MLLYSFYEIFRFIINSLKNQLVMRKIISYPVVLVAALVLHLSLMAQKSDSKRVEGSGNVITKDVSVQSFTELEASGVFSLHLTQGDKEGVKIEADDNLQELFEVKNEGSRLKITMKKDVNINGNNTMKVYVSFKKLKSMDLSMVGSTKSDEKLSFDDLKLKNQSVGSVNLDMAVQTLHMENESVGTVSLKGSADNAVIKTNSVGSFKAGDFVVQKLDIDNSGIGGCEVNAAKELKVSESFLGKVKNKGNAKKSGKVVI